MAKWLHIVSAPCWNWTVLPDSLRLTLTNKPQDCLNLPKVKVYESSYFATLNQKFTCRIFIFRYQGQTRYTSSLLQTFINTYNHILHRDYGRVELKYFFLVRSKNLKFRTELQDQVMDGWSVTLQMIIFSSRLLITSQTQKI